MNINGKDYDTEIRPRLAEFCGWRQDAIGLWSCKGDFPRVEPFDPLRSHSDCMALIEALNRAGKGVQIDFATDGGIQRVDCRVLLCDDYREGVVTLADPIALAESD